MFTIIGGDGKEYGPVSTDQVRGWVADGRANLQTRARVLGTETWRTLGDFIEFSPGAEFSASPGGLAGDGAGAGPAPGPGGGPGPSQEAADGPKDTGAWTAGGTAPAGGPGSGADTDLRTLANQLIARAGKLEILSCYERAWELLKSDFWTIVGVYGLVTLIPVVILWYLSPHLGLLPAVSGSPLPVQSANRFLTPVISVVFSLFQGGLYAYLILRIRGLPATLADAFSGLTRTPLPLLAGAVVSSMFTTVGFCLLILPGVYLALAYAFLYPLIVDRKLGFWAAMEVSRRVISAQWFRLLGLMLLAVPFLLLGLAALGVGVLITGPLVTLAFLYAYSDLCTPGRQAGRSGNPID